VLVRAWRWGAFWGRLLMGSRGGTYMDRNRNRYGQARPATKGTNASRPTTISRPGKVAWRAWPAITLRSQWRSQAIAILHLVLIAAVLCCILGQLGIGEEGAALPVGRLLSLMGLMIQVAPVAAQIRGLRSGGLSWCRVCVGARGADPSGAPPCPLLWWSSVGSVFSCSGETCFA